MSASGTKRTLKSTELTSASDPKRTFSKFCCLSVSKIETFRRLGRRYLRGCSRSPEGVTFAACSPRGGAMTDPCSRRKLTAILSADAVGYSRLMAADEAATVETLKAYRDIIVRLVARRGGRVVNAPGDALLAESPVRSRRSRPPSRSSNPWKGTTSNSKRTGACSSASGSIWAT